MTRVRLITLNTQLLPLQDLPVGALRRLLGQASRRLDAALRLAATARIPPAVRSQTRRLGAVVDAASATVDRADVLAHLLIEQRPDIVCLQEVFDGPARRHLIARLSPFLPYIVEPHRAPGVAGSSGLMTLSRWPLVSEPRAFTWSASEDADRFAAKGCLLATFGDDDLHVSVANCHLQAGPWPAVRTAQLAELRRCLDKAYSDAHAEIKKRDITPYLISAIGGDFNIDGRPSNPDAPPPLPPELAALQSNLPNGYGILDSAYSSEQQHDLCGVATNADGRVDYWLLDGDRSNVDFTDGDTKVSSARVDVRETSASDHDGWLVTVEPGIKAEGGSSWTADAVTFLAATLAESMHALEDTLARRPVIVDEPRRPASVYALYRGFRTKRGDKVGRATWRKPVAACHAMGDISHPDARGGQRIDMGWMSAVAYPGVPEAEPPTCRFGAGATFDALNAALGADRDRGRDAGADRDRGRDARAEATRHRMLRTQPGYGRLSFVGAMSVGGHGSGARFGALASDVTALEMSYVGESRELVEAKRFVRGDDESLNHLMRAALVGLGLVGVITEATVTLAEVERANIAEVRERRSWRELVSGDLAELVEWSVNDELEHPKGNGRALGIPHSFEVWINPYDLDHVVVGKRWLTDEPVAERRALLLRESVPVIAAQRVLERRGRRGHLDLDAMIETQRLALGSVTRPQRVVMCAATGLSFGAANRVDALASSVAVPWGNLVGAVEAIHEAAVDLAESDGGSPRERLLASPIGIRIVKGDAADQRPYLAPQFPAPEGAEVAEDRAPNQRVVGTTHEVRARYTAMIEMPTMRDFRGADEVLTAVVRRLVDDHHGRPHWGQYLPIDADDVRAMYGKDLDAFLKARQELDPHGVFDNRFARRLGLCPDEQAG